MRKLTLLGAFGLGYRLGSRAGREHYDRIKGTFDQVRHDPRVREKTQQAVDVARQQAPVVAEKVAGAASAASAAVATVSGSQHGPQTGQPAHMSWALQDLP